LICQTVRCGAADGGGVEGGGASRNSIAIYDFVHQEVQVEIDTSSQIRTSSLRSLGAYLNVYAIKCAMDVNGRVKVSQRAAQNVATLGLARLPRERAPASGRPRFS
jgi:hypothetical protein